LTHRASPVSPRRVENNETPPPLAEGEERDEPKETQMRKNIPHKPPQRTAAGRVAHMREIRERVGKAAAAEKAAREVGQADTTQS
jgi:hypothetical protein